jgi:hypothetical protein
MLSPDEQPVVVRRLVSCISLVPGIDVGWISLVLGIGRPAHRRRARRVPGRSHRQDVAGALPWLHRLRVTSLSVVATLLYAIEGLPGLCLILRPADMEALRWLAVIVIGFYGLGILWPWTLLGNPRHGWSGWLNPVQDLELERAPTTETDIATDPSTR